VDDEPLIPDGTVAADVMPFLGWLLPRESAPSRFLQQLGEVVPDWRIDPPETDAGDFHIAAIAPDRSGSVAIVVDWTTEAGYRPVDGWKVHGHGPHEVAVAMELRHDAGQPEFDAAVRVLRATWAPA
jgi:hypothetical protein